MTSVDLSKQSGVLPVHKPVGPTSRRVVDEVEDRLTNCKIGHGGTLDPMAEGLLPLHFNEATKLVQYLHKQRKTYRFRVRFDYRSDSFDLGETVESVNNSHNPRRKEFEKILPDFVGTYDQHPPKYSALRSDGDRFHELARKSQGKAPDARAVTCHDLSLLHYDFPGATLRVTCGKGFYVRSLVRDLGDALNLKGGVATALVRTQYGPYSLGDSAKLHEPNQWSLYFTPPRSAVRTFPWIRCDAETITHLTNGKWIDREPSEKSPAMAIGPDQKLHAILEATDERGKNQWRPRRVLNRSIPTPPTKST